MALTTYINDIPNMLIDIEAALWIERIAIIHEPTPATGQPFVSVFVEAHIIQPSAVGPGIRTSAFAFAMRYTYTDGTVFEPTYASFDSPFFDPTETGSRAIPYNFPTWYRLYEDTLTDANPNATDGFAPLSLPSQQKVEPGALTNLSLIHI